MYESIGKSHEGHDLWLVKISDNVEINESEPGVLYTGGMHGDEKPGYQVLIESIISILENYTSPNVDQSFTDRINNVVNNSELFFIPMVNPDGCEANRRKNGRQNKCPLGKTLLRGVDISRNFDYNWEDANKHPFRYIFIPRTLKDVWFLITHKNFYLFERGVVRYPLFDFGSIIGGGFYRGPYPFSEPETRAIKHVLENYSISISVDYHIYGEEVRYYNGDNFHHPSDADTFYSIAENISKVNGYEIFEKPDCFNTSGSGLNWIYSELGIFSFVIELCPSMKSKILYDKDFMSDVFEKHLLINLYIAERAMTMG